ncbi:MAG: hypothetical protein JWO06_2549 [Bacteroidota bacterium]|nr:hypothetical protein [Bacteroidota bacterium]
MVKTASGLLTIQKFIYLLDDFHYYEFSNYLSLINASLPLRLTEAIRNKLPDFDTSQDLCKKVYGGFDKSHQQNFNQLTSYTFKHSAVLAQNYPGYLHGKIPALERLVNEGKRDESNVMADALLDMAERIEDFQCHAMVLKFLSQQAFLVKDTTAAFKLSARLEECIANEKLFTELQTTFRNAEHVVDYAKARESLKGLKQYYQTFKDHPSSVIRIFSQFAYISSIYSADIGLFAQPDVEALIRLLEKDLANYPYVVFPFLTDIEGNFGFLKLNSPLVKLNSKEGEKEYEDLTEHYNSVKFWRSYLSFWQLHLIAIQVTRLLTAYHYQIHRSDYRKLISANDWRWVKSLIEKCDELLNIKTFIQHYEYEIRSLKMMYGALLIIAGGNNIKKGVAELESLLIAYQQVNMRGSTDSVYLCLMVGYFSLKNYEMCAKTFRRYTKVIKDKPVFEGNDSKIHAYYYLSQWLATNSKQYPTKMGLLLKRLKGAPPESIVELMQHFEMPVAI